MAGGFTINKKNIDIFRDFLISNFKRSQANLLDTLNLYLDSKIAPSALNEEFYEHINCLAPFGSGNREPKFVIENLQVIASNTVGENHIRSILRGKDGYVFKSFTWNAINSPLEAILNNNKKRFDAAGKMKMNEWRGKKSIEFVIEDISLH